MKVLSTLALAATLAVGIAPVAVSTPAAAAEKKKDEGPQLKLSENFRKAAAPAQTALAAKNVAGAEPLVAAAAAAATTDDEKYVAETLQFDLARQKLLAAQAANPNAPRDESSLAAPLDALIANPKTPAASKPQFYYVRGVIAFNGKQNAVAADYLAKARAGGYPDPGIDLMIAKAKYDAGDVAGGSAELEGAITKAKASGKPAPEDYYKYAVARALKAKDKALTLSWLGKWASAYPTPQTWRDVLVTYGLSTPAIDTLDKPQRIDLFRLMHDTKALADQSLYEQYAQDVIDRGLPGEALTVIKEGQAAGKLQQSRAVGEELTQANAAVKAEGSLAPLEAKAKTGADGKLAQQTADAYLGRGDNAKAVELYRLALSKGGVANDEVNTHLGIALSRMGDKAGALAAFGQVKGGARGNLATLWTYWVQSQA